MSAQRDGGLELGCGTSVIWYTSGGPLVWQRVGGG